MDLAELLRAVGRRWYVLVLGLLTIAGLVFLTLRFVPVTYDAKSSILLLPPASAAEKSGNPFLDLGGLDLVAGVLGKSLTDSESVRSIIPSDSKGEYTVEKDASVSGSVLEVAASGASPKDAFATLDAVLALASERLDQLQTAAGAQADAHVRLMVITNNTVAEPNIASLVRALIVVVAAGLSLTLLLTVTIDSAVRRRRAKKVERQHRQALAQAPAPPAAPPGRSESAEPVLVGERE